MQQFGTASVYGIDGTAAYDGGLAIAAFVSGYAGEDQMKVDEFMSGLGEFIGARTYDQREFLDLTLTPKKTAAAGSLNDALKALKYPPKPAKVTVAGLPDTDTAGGHSANEIGHNGDYMYWGGARRTMHQGQAALQIRVWRSLTSPLTTAQLLTVAT
jgi:hypothetical protein